MTDVLRSRSKSFLVCRSGRAHRAVFLVDDPQPYQDGAWVPGLSGRDPNESGGNIDDPTDDTLDTLRYARAIHRKAISAINDFINQAKINRQGSTPVPPDPQKFGRRG